MPRIRDTSNDPRDPRGSRGSENYEVRGQGYGCQASGSERYPGQTQGTSETDPD